MLRIYQSTNTTEAIRYYTQCLATADYYLDRFEIPGSWGGRAAQQLGLEGDVEQRAFARLCRNTHPGTGERLTPRTREDRTVGYDLTFHAPKGVSLLYALTEDPDILGAMQRAVRETMAELETNTQTRVRLGGKSEDRPTANLAWAEFTHCTGRPVEGEPDPQLHMHCYVFNATHDPVEDRWKAAQFRDVVRDHPYFQAVFHTRLATYLSSLGYPVARTQESWDFFAIDRGLVDKFSRRTAEIEQAARRLGITDPTDKAALGARTRATKDKSLSPDELQARWQQRLDPAEQQWIDWMAGRPGLASDRDNTDNEQSRVARQHTLVANRSRITPEQALDHAIRHVYERKAVESDRRLMAEALKFGLHDVSVADLWQALDTHPELLTRRVEGQRWVTTRDVVREECRVLSFAVEGKGCHAPLGAGYRERTGERYELGRLSSDQGFDLNPSQRGAIEHLLSSRDRVMMLRGGAGTGKTTLLMEAAAAIQHGGKRVFACAVTADASRGTLREAGFAKAETLQKLLTDRKLQDQLKGQVLWVDEAGMVGTPTMRRLFDVAERIEARVVLSGDTKQHAPVERGDAMALLERQAGLEPAEVTEIIRQQGVYKDAVDAMDRGRLSEAVQHLDRMEAITEIRDPESPERRHAELANRYIETVSRKQSALVVSPTHAEGQAVTQIIRDRLKEAGAIEAEDQTITRLQDTQWTDATKADAHRYEPGMVVQFTQHCPGVTRKNIAPAAAGTKAKVIAIDAEKGFITTEDAAGHRRPLPLSMPERFQVYREQQIGLAAGDTVRVTRHSHTLDGKHRLTNGTHYKVEGFTPEGHIVLANKGKWVVHKKVGHLNHGYCTTPQAAQGKSVDKCFAAVSSASLSSSTLEQIYVILSRGKKGVELLTDRREGLIDAIARIDRARSATELLSEQPEPTRQQQLMSHAREVQRLRGFEATRQQVQRDRQQAFARMATRAMETGERRIARGGPERQPRPSRATRRRGPDRGAPGRER
ncbi:MAG: MobF family relaxase [Planctomycetota bacterium]